MAPLTFLIVCLAAWRLAYLIAEEDGPFEWAIRVRQRLGGYDLDQHSAQPKTWLGRGVRCVYCVSFWTGLLCAGLAMTEAAPLLWWPAASAGALIVHRYVRRE